ncbi:MAG TPA: carbohydrate kinase family protein [Candidatus Portnoybacteria bacterium]|nr:carbohydrate kinase family protein [Candidatus Portnoybacteria bacterium]
MSFDVITFGSATIDIFVLVNSSKKENSFDFPLGEKIPMKNIFWATGGGGTNTAATFAKQGLKTAWVGKIGQDWAGEIVKNQLIKSGITVDFIQTDSQYSTSTSVVLSSSDGRAILTNHQADRYLQKEKINWPAIKDTKWFYLAPLSGKLAHLTAQLINFAGENNITVAINPSLDQINLGYNFFQDISDKIDVLLINQEEAAQLTKTEITNEKGIIEKLKNLKCKFIVMTQGPKGVKVISQLEKKIYQASIPKSDYLDRTGTGDAFGSGLVSRLIKGKSIAEAIQYGTANATDCLQKLGAQNGLLSQDNWGKWKKVEVKVSEL